MKSTKGSRNTKQTPTCTKRTRETEKKQSEAPAFDRDAFLKRLEEMGSANSAAPERYDAFGYPLPSTTWWQGFLFELWRDGVDISDPTNVLFTLCEHLRREFYCGPLPWERSGSRVNGKKPSRPNDRAELRTLNDIRRAEEELFEKLWYSRHRESHTRAMRDPSYDPTAWAKAIAEADVIEASYPKGELPPWDDYAHGMVCGKLSAMRWVLGDDWDSLDT